MRMLCLMARATPVGELRVAGQPCTVADLAKAVGEPQEMVAELLSELDQRGVFSRTRSGVIFNRKMRKQAEISRKRAKAGAKGASVTNGEKRETEICRGKNSAKPSTKSRPQKPEARVQSKEESDKSLSSARRKKEPERFQDFWDAFPHRGGAKKGRAESLKKYARIVSSGVSEQTLIAAAMRYHKDRRVLDGYGKGPVPWLNQRCWEDDIEPQLNAIHGGRNGATGTNPTPDAIAIATRMRRS